MRRFLLLFFFSILVEGSFGTVKNITLKTGEVYELSPYDIGYSYFTPLEDGFTNSGEATALEYGFNGHSVLYIHGITPGYSFISFQTNSGLRTTYVFHVLDIIPDKIDMVVGNTYTYTPVFAGKSKTGIKNFTWTSSDLSIAKVDANGCVTAISSGKATITASATFNSEGTGVSEIKSVVTVSEQLTKELKLNKKSQDLDVGSTSRLTATVSPDNTTNKAVKWLSTNENIAQVDDEGNVTAIAPGYCSILCIADDGSKKYDKCLVHVQGASASRADVNGDGKVSVTDAFSVIDVILNQ